jgi:2,4-dienoyl-CoA reductase-like NADH-dependent reductase (Old Yellow Enzyme family)
MGGTIEARCRWPGEVVARVREAAGPDMAVLVKTNVTDGFNGGITPDDAAAAARTFEAAGADAVVTSGGFTSRTPFHMLRGEVPVRRMVRNEASWVRRMGLAMFGRAIVRAYPFEPTYYLREGTPIARALGIPAVLVGGVCDLDDLERAREAGFSFVQMGRAIIRDPRFPERLSRGEVTGSDCDHCNRCVAAMDKGGVHCVTRVEDGR